jgi:hypothetical protein
MLASGIDLQVVTAVSLMERWVFISSFAGFFAGVLLRVGRIFKREFTEKE